MVRPRIRIPQKGAKKKAEAEAAHQAELKRREEERGPEPAEGKNYIHTPQVCDDCGRGYWRREPLLVRKRPGLFSAKRCQDCFGRKEAK
jgi:hypothetical protein